MSAFSREAVDMFMRGNWSPGAVEHLDATLAQNLPIPAAFARRDRDGMAVIGRTLHDLRGIRFVEGEDGNQPAGEQPQEPEQPKPAPKPGPPPVKAQPQTPAEDPEPVEGSEDGGKTFSADYVEKLRRENARKRTEEKEAIQKQIDEALATGQKEWAQQLGKALGLVEDENPDPEKIIEQLTTERDDFKQKLAAAEQRDLARKQADAITSAARTHGGDVDLVTPYLKGTGALKDIDPTADDYDAQVAAVVKEQIEKNPKLRQVQVANQSSGDEPHTGDPDPDTDDSVDAIRKRRQKRRGY